MRKRREPELQVRETVRVVRIRSRLGLGPLEELVVYSAAVLLGSAAGALFHLL